MRRIDATAPDYDDALQALLARREEDTTAIAEVVREVVAAVQTRGDAALIDYTARWDHRTLTPETLRVPPSTIRAALEATPAPVRRALHNAAARIEAYSNAQLPADHHTYDEYGTLLGWRWNPIMRVGLYVPGGTAAYPSSVLMNAMPAKVAGVERLVVVVPNPSAAVLAACAVAGIDEVYAIGGAQAVAALAYGTETIPAVDKIVGPGNVYVAEAKRQVFGRVGIDMIAGPSEIVVVADGAQQPEWIAADLLSQAEHDVLAQAVLITDSPALADAVARAVESQLEHLPRKAIAAAAWRDFGAIITVPNLATVPAIVNRLAPEHLELMVVQPEVLLQALRCAGAIFVGNHTPEAIGDYIAGPSHVLPTSHTARFASGLSVFDFLTRTSLVGCTSKSFAALADDAIALADAEGLHAHAFSMRVRSGK